MTANTLSSGSAQYPFAPLLRAGDRDPILVQIMASVWESILKMPNSRDPRKMPRKAMAPGA